MEIKKAKISILNDDTLSNMLKENTFYNKKVSLNETIEIEDITFDSCYFDKISFNTIKLDNVFFIDCVFNKCDLSNYEFFKTNMTRCEFINCKLVGTSFIESVLYDIRITDSMCKYINLSNSKCHNIIIKESNLEKGIFRSLDIKNWILDESDFTGAEFFKTKLKDIDFSNCTILGINIDLDSIKGMVVNEEQAMLLSVLLGIKIK